MQGSEVRMEVPFQRFAWTAALLCTPAACLGWLTVLTPDWLGWFYLAYGVALLVSLVVTPLSWSDYVGKNLGKGVLGCLALLAVLAGTLWLLVMAGFRELFAPLAAALFYLGPVFLFGLANPQGMTLWLILVQGFVAGGLAQGFAVSDRLGLALVVPLGALVLGIVGSLVRRMARSSS